MQCTTIWHLVRIRNLRAVVLVLSGAVAAATVTASCLAGTATFVCESGRRCPAGQVCAADQDICIPEHSCGDGIIEPGEVCDDGNTVSGDGCSKDCKSNEQCGNGILDQGEVCDDNNTIDGDGCSSDCFKEECGNGILNSGEVCDDGNAVSGDGCSKDCKSIEACGNGIIDKAVGEECEFDNKPFPHHFLDTATCDNDCTFPICGDGHTNTANGEQCDPGRMLDGNALDSEGCDSDCTFVACGDGHLNKAAGENCDLGSSLNSDLPNAICRKNCQPASCGDGIVDDKRKEQCDDGNDDTADDCPSGPTGNCKPATCGDGFLRTKDPDREVCDWGAQEDGHDLGCNELNLPVCENSGPSKCKTCAERMTPLKSTAEGVTARSASQR